MGALCSRCKAETLPVAVFDSSGASAVVLVDPQPNDQGDLHIRHNRWGWDGRRRLNVSVPVLRGWTSHRTHVCSTPEEK